MDLWKANADIYTVGQCLLFAFRQLTQPLMQRHLYDDWVRAVKHSNKPVHKVAAIRKMIRSSQIPEMEGKVLKHLLLILHRISNKTHTRKSKATCKSLAAIWAPVLLRPDGFRSDNKESGIEVMWIMIQAFQHIVRHTSVTGLY